MDRVYNFQGSLSMKYLKCQSKNKEEKESEV